MSSISRWLAVAAAMVLGFGPMTGARALSPVSPDGAKSRGTGVYPGNPAQYAGPQLKDAGASYRNLALNRIATASSSYDYNLTAQLVTDGIMHDGEAPWLEVLVDGEPVPRDRREFLFDDKPGTRLEVQGKSPLLTLHFHGMPVSCTRVQVDGEAGWKALTQQSVQWSRSQDGESFSLRLHKKGCEKYTLNAVSFYDGDVLQDVLPNRHFHSAWKSAGGRDEWVCIDLGAAADIDRIVFHWQNAPVSGTVQISDDGQSWRNIGPVSEDMDCRESGRYVRALLDRTADGRPFELKEWEILGRGGLVPVAQAAPERQGARQELTRGGWTLMRASEVSAGGEELSSVGYDDWGWLPATVPGTVLACYVNAGAVPDPNVADMQFHASDSFFRSAFWYRTTFLADCDSPRQFLHFDGINFRAEIFLNGKRLGQIDGAFREGDFDVTGLLRDGENALAVLISPNEHFGTIKEKNAWSTVGNGGTLGADNPTMHATIGWDWLPTVRGRSAGILDDVYLRFTGPVTMKDQFVRTVLPLPDTTYSHVLAEVTLVNHSDRPVEGILKGSFGPVGFTLRQSLAPGESRLVKADSLLLDSPRLWWPNNYGEPYLYPVKLLFEADGSVSDSCSFFSAVRQWEARFDKTEPDRAGCTDRLNLYINGKRFTAFGGNWGLSEHLLNYREREYDIAVRYHRDQHFTMIRNWVGQIYDREFFEACDRYGIVVWQDFWLANPADGPVPSDNSRFCKTAREWVRRLRNHPSIGIYVGRNEGNPPSEIDSFLADMTASEHPGIYYLSNSADGPVSGRGPYRALPPKEYRSLFGLEKLHSERGMPVLMNIENLTRALGAENLEPVSTLENPARIWGLHDWALGYVSGASSAQRTYTFNQLLEEAFGKPSGAREFAELSQWISYNGLRAIFESRSAHRQGMLLWMSHPAWPSLVWQTYDYYLEPTAAYFACKNACEPLHIQWNASSGNVEAVSWYACSGENLKASASVLDMNGAALWTRSETVSVGADQTVVCFPLEVPDNVSDAYFVNLVLTDESGRTVSENTYWEGREPGRLETLRTLPMAELSADIRCDRTEEGYKFTLKLTNTGSVPALMVRLKVTDGESGDLVLPVMYSDNYLFIFPGNTREITATVNEEDCKGVPQMRLSGLNLKPSSWIFE